MANPITALDVRLLRTARRRAGSTCAVPVARALSHGGEHALAWVVVAGAGAVLQPARRRDWVRAGALVVGAHGLSVALKRLVRRPRPDLRDCPPLVGAPSRLSFPSSHMTSTSAAVLLLVPMLTPGAGTRAVLAGGLVSAMGGSRVLLGVHYPSDVVAGWALGSAVAVAGRRLVRRRPGRR